MNNIRRAPRFVPDRLRGFDHVQEHNWLNHDIIVQFLQQVAAEVASGVLVDIGCGIKPYRSVFAPYVSKHVGIDSIDRVHQQSAVDAIANAYHVSLRDCSCDTILCTEVLEHLEEPRRALDEMNRILRNQGIVIVTVPLFWPIHDAPMDFYRYSEYGLRYLFEDTGFEIIDIWALTGYVVTFTQLSIYFFRRFSKGFVLRNIGRVINWVLQHLALWLNQYDGSREFTCLYGLVARKLPQAQSCSDMAVDDNGISLPA